MKTEKKYILSLDPVSYTHLDVYKRQVEGNAVAQLIYDGFWDGVASIQEDHKLEEVSHLYGGAWTEEAGLQMAEDMLVANEHIDIMFAISDPFLMGALTACERAGRSEMFMLSLIHI